ncbi:hypothetical protein LCGC14_0890420 [marine sediment metagenome]|uniref:B box-type domain-containing protein n=1 Tax=marine sediment metagenome TaxID=412755 RepID=A0A0F9PK97_9ZZZZ
MAAEATIECKACRKSMTVSDSYSCIRCGKNDFCLECCEAHEDCCGFEDED